MMYMAVHKHILSPLDRALLKHHVEYSYVFTSVTLSPSLIYSQHETAHVLWSWNDNDPVNNVPSFHQFQGVTSLNLLGGLVDPPQDPPDAQTFSITVNNVRMHA